MIHRSASVNNSTPDLGGFRSLGMRFQPFRTAELRRRRWGRTTVYVCVNAFACKHAWRQSGVGLRLRHSENERFCMDSNVSGKQTNKQKKSRKPVSTNNIQGVVDHTRQERIQNLLLQGYFDKNHRRLGFFFFICHSLFSFFIFSTVSTVIAKVMPSRKSLAHSVRTNEITWFITF